MKTNELSMWQKEAPGFSAWVDLSDDETAYLGVNNFNDNLFTKRENYARELFLDYYEGDKSCPGCPNDCIKYLNPDPKNIPTEVKIGRASCRERMEIKVIEITTL